MVYVLIALHGTKDNIQGYRLLEITSHSVLDFTKEKLYNFISANGSKYFYGVDIKDRRGNIEFTQAHHGRYTYLYNNEPTNGVHLTVLARSNNGGGADYVCSDYNGNLRIFSTVEIHRLANGGNTVNTLSNAKIGTGGTVAPFRGSLCKNYTAIVNAMGELVQIPVGREMTDKEIKSWIGQAVFKRNKRMRLTVAETIVLKLLNAHRKITGNEVRNLIFATTDNTLASSTKKQIARQGKG